MSINCPTNAKLARPRWRVTSAVVGVVVTSAIAAAWLPGLSFVLAADANAAIELTPQVGASARGGQGAENTDAPERADAPDRSDAADRVREGTRWQNERGVFTLVGDRVTFTRGGQNYVVLENLNLERIVRTIEENRTVTDADTLEWNVDATVTEFRGANFVLVTRSVLVARPRGTTAAP